MFKIGDKVVCINNNDLPGDFKLELYKTYTVIDFNTLGEHLKLDHDTRFYWIKRFTLKKLFDFKNDLKDILATANETETVD